MAEIHLFQNALNVNHPWYIERTDFFKEDKIIDIWINFYKGSTFPCPICESDECKAYDTEIKNWHHLNFFEYRCDLYCRMPRVFCEKCGVHMIEVPWARQRSGFSLLMESFILILADDMPISKIAALLGEDDERIMRVVTHYVEEARANEKYDDVVEIGIDETSSRKGHNYITVVIDLKKKKVIFVTEGKDNTTVKRFVEDFEKHGGDIDNIKSVCSDLSAAFIKGIKENIPNAIHTFDKFHIMKLIIDALDEVRREEQRTTPDLKKTRYLWRKNPESLTKKELSIFEPLSKRNLKTARPYRMKEAFKELWESPNIEVAKQIFKEWYFWATHSQLPPMIKMAKTLNEHKKGILNFIETRINNGAVEAINGKIQALKRIARGYRNPDNYKTMIYLHCGKLNFNLPT
jgi:transposase